MEHVAYIKRTKTGRFRGVIATLTDVGDPDGDKLVYDVASSDMFEDLDEAIEELKSQCKISGISLMHLEPVTRGMALYESELTWNQS